MLGSPVVWAVGGSGQKAAVDSDVGAGDVGGLVGQQERDHGRDLPTAARAPQRYSVGRDGCRALRVGGGHLGVDDAGLKFDDADALRAVVLGSAACQAADAVLGAGVVAVQR